jgi:asparagine synthase (glutamine-hydrolysing)
MTIAGASAATVRAAIETGDPLPGTGGFAGALDGTLVRDVLGRYPLFFESGDPTTWSHDPAALGEPRRLPAGHVCARDDSAGVDPAQVGQPRRLFELPDPEPCSTDEAAVAAVRAALDDSLSAVAETVGVGELSDDRADTDASDPGDGGVDDTDAGDLAVAFSGGVDSGLLAARLDAPLYVVGFPDSHDIEAARSGAALLGREVRVVELDHATLEAAIPRVVAAIGRTNPMAVQIALPLFVLAEQVSADGFDRLALGQGADELFGGYAKVENAPDDHRVAANTVRAARDELLDTLPDQFERDRLALDTAGVDPVAPLAHDRVVRAALALDGDQLVREGTRKWALRAAARTWLPDELAGRDKKALQYGTLASRELDRLARQAGYKRRIDDHVRKYIESL